MAKLFHLPQQDEVPPQLNLEEQSDAWWAFHLPTVRSTVALTAAAVTLSASLCWGLQQQTDELSWALEDAAYELVLPRPILRAVQPLCLPDPDHWRVVVLDEEAWVTPWVIPRPSVGLPVWVDEELPVTPAAVVEEDLWDVSTRPRQPARFLYLPDPEEVPAGSLVGVPEQDPWEPPVVQAAQVSLQVWAVDDEWLGPAPADIALEVTTWEIVRIMDRTMVMWW